jgi:hypothetical protein
MARRRYARAAKALTQLSKGKQETQFNQLKSQDIRAGTEAAVESMNKKFAMAGQAMVTADALVQGYKTKGKIEKGVTSLAEAKGGDVSYKKTGLGDIFRGEAKLSEWGKESWDIGGDKYDRADVLAFEEKGRKDLKWDSVIGKELTTMDEDGGISTERKKVKPREKKDYTIEGDTALLDKTGMDYEKKYGKGWSYKKQKAIGKLSDVDKQFGTGGGEGILRSQVAANVGSSNYGTISKAFKSEYSGNQNLMKGIKTLDLKHQAAIHHQKPKEQGADEVKGVIKSSTAIQSKSYGSGGRSPLEMADDIAKEKAMKYQPDALDSSTLEDNTLANKLSSTAETASKSIDKILASDKPTSYVAERPKGTAYDSPGGFFTKPTADSQYKSDKKWREQQESEDAGILSKARTMQAEHEKVRGEVASLTSGDDYVSPNDPSLSGGGMFIDEFNKSKKGNDAVETTSTYEPQSISVNMGGLDSADAGGGYKGSSSQNISVLEEMMSANFGDLQGSNLYEGMDVADIWNKGPLSQKYGDWSSGSAKTKRESMWAQMGQYEG